MKRSVPDRELYQRMVARLAADRRPIGGRSRQIDVLIDAGHDSKAVAAVAMRQRIRIEGEKRWT